ncbi:hypothetical protein [Streptomyces sp. NPDC002265]|uniref:hypothetical protein n=1 Tax=Streptomyces sp. NPDC002265 TaxID=3154415 RepID=UPI00332CAEEB
MAIHFTTFVMPGAAMGQPHDTPFLVLGAETAEEIDTIPAVTSMHRVGNHAMLLCHAAPVLAEVPVTDLWGKVSAEQYDARAKVVVVRDPVPADITTQYADLTQGCRGTTYRRGWAGC